MSRSDQSRRDVAARRGADAAAAAVARPGLRIVDALVALPAWASVLTIFVSGRLLSLFWLAAAFPLVGRSQPANAIRGNDHGFLAFLTSWDGQYYEDISIHGYPSALPVDSAGHVLQNAWAFLPAFPFTIRALTASTGIPFTVGAPLVATLAGFVAAFLMYLLVEERAGRTAALWGVFFFCVGPLSFLLQVGYAESMFLALVFGALVAMQRRRYGVMTALGVVAAFTRPGALAIPLTLAVIAVVRLVLARRDARAAAAPAVAAVPDDRPVVVGAAPDHSAVAGSGSAAHRLLGASGRALPEAHRLLGTLPRTFPVRERVLVVLSGVVMTLAGIAWPLIASHATGRSDAYLATEMSWWVAFIGRVHFVPMTPWFLNAGRWLGVGGIVLVIAMVIGYVVWLRRPSTRKLGLVPLVFSAAYALYVFAVSIPMASTPRLVMPLAPLMASPELVGRPWARWIMVSGALVGQPVCIAVLWLLGPP
ncbi:hypothetical protein [Curtobacterium sp. RRHDQ10]|uniref:hypothetical protein n=1 Tax=Curtobacterium phyllosphaerae TaxID=3413379 RepID=UPI003BF25135